MKLRKEDLEYLDRMLELYVKDELSHFDTMDISHKLNIENGHARFLRDKIGELNYELEFFRVELTNSGDIFPLEDGKFLISRFIQDGGCQKHYSESFVEDERSQIIERIDGLYSGQILLAEGQSELSEEMKEILEQMKVFIYALDKKNWTNLLRDQVFAACIATGINAENAESLIDSIKKSIGID